MPRDNQGRPPGHKEERIEHNTKRPVERNPIDQVRKETKRKVRDIK